LKTLEIGNETKILNLNHFMAADRCYVCARATLVYCKIPPDSVVGAGAVATEDFSKEGTGLLLAGNPAKIKRRLISSLPATPDDAPDFNDCDCARLS
jgi:carbonic anhydrase/acetyltransferase-like protein (isoleucine patch superfamily)